MKAVIYILAVFVCSCKNKTVQNKNVSISPIIKAGSIQDTNILLPKLKADRKKYYTTKDTVYIYSASKDTIKYSKNEFNGIIDDYPELYEGAVNNPESTYSRSSFFVGLIDSAGNESHLSFGSEAGQDGYYILYAYFLKHKNGIAKYSVRRKKLLEIYSTLNDLFDNLNYGGTYYGHQYSRIEGYAEFSVYWFAHYQDYFDRPYDITKQRAYYIAGLKQLILDEEKIDYNTYNHKEKVGRGNELFKKVANLNNLITDNFYLRMAQSFQSDHY